MLSLALPVNDMVIVPADAVRVPHSFNQRGARSLSSATISHQEPLPIRLMRSVEHLCLSPRRAEVCSLMANGASVENIARRLGISTHTAVAHGRWIYERLNVHTRTELLSKLLTVPSQ